MARRQTRPRRSSASRSSTGRGSGQNAERGVPTETVDGRPAGRRQLSFPVLLGAVCSIALLLRLINVLQTVEMPTVVQLLGDAKSYFQWATRIAGGQWYGTETFYQAPLYPYTLAVLIKVFDSGVLGIRVVQALLGAASVLLLGVAAKNTFHNSAADPNKVGVIAAAMYAVYPPAIYYDGIIQKASLASFLLCCVLAGCGLLGRDHYLGVRGRSGVALLIGLTLGLLVLTRENSLLWIPIFPIWIWLGLSDAWKNRAIWIACYLLGLALVLLPVAARNASLGGEWSPTTFQAGPNFYIGNNLQSNGVYRPLVPGHETPMTERADAQRLAEQAAGRTLSSREVSTFWFERSFQEIREDPFRWVQLMVVKSLMVVNRYEVPDIESMYVYRDYSWPLRLLGPLWHFGILCPFAFWGFAATREHWRSLWLYYLLILVMVAAVVLFFILGRYRQPLVPLLALFGTMGLLDVVRRLRMKDWTGIRLRLAATLLVAVACNITVHDESRLNASSYMNMGIAAAQSGDMGTSLKTLARAVQTHPEMAEAHLNLGRALELSNRVPEAIVCFRNALRLEPSLAMGDALLAESYERIGDPQNALLHYRRAIALDPTDGQSRQAIERLSRSGR